MVFFKRQEADFHKSLAMLQAAVNPGKEVEEHFDNYRNSAFPFVKGGKKYDSIKAKTVLERLRGKVVSIQVPKEEPRLRRGRRRSLK